MRLASLLSGGKDSINAIQLAVENGHEVTDAVTIFPQRRDSYMFHVPNLWLTGLQTESMGINHVRWESSGEKEAEVLDLRDALSTLDIDGVVVGAIRSTYQRSRVERVCAELGLAVIAPLWGVDGLTHLEKLLAGGYEIVIVGVYADGMGPDWLGRVLDSSSVRELEGLGSRKGVDIAFEGGEAETVVTDCPIFARRLDIQDAEVRWEGIRGEYIIKKARLF